MVFMHHQYLLLLYPVKNRPTFSKPFHNNIKYPAMTKIITVLNNSSIYTSIMSRALLATCFLLAYTSTLKMREVCSSETSVDF
jgi:hypothetical protein